MKCWAALLVSVLASCPRSSTSSSNSIPLPTRTPSSAAAPSEATREALFVASCADASIAPGEELVLLAARHVYDAPERLQRWAFHPEGSECPADDLPAHLGLAPRRCVALSRLRMRELARALTSHGLRSLRTRALPEGAHHGGTDMTLVWSGGRCRVGDISNDIEIHADDRDAFNACWNDLAAATRP